MSKLSEQPPVNKKSHIAERVAFDPFLPQQDLINELIRNMINPDTDIGQSYYLGQIVDIIDEGNHFIDNRDIFYSPSDNFERATKTISDKKYNSKRVTLLVHIPSFMTNPERSPTISSLNYNTFTKLRVEYEQDSKGSVRRGNTVKIQFRDKNGFYNPYVIDVQDITSANLMDDSKRAKTAFDEYLNCKNLQIQFPIDIGSTDFISSTNPAGGYVQALREINNIFLPDYINSFVSTTKYKNVIIKAKKVSIYVDAYAQFKDLGNYSFDLLSYSGSVNNYLINGDEIIIASSNGTEQNLRDDFYSYVSKDFASKLNYAFTPSTTDNTFSVDMNLDFIGGSKKVEDYINTSKKMLDSTTYYSRILPKKLQPVTVQPKDNADKCDSSISNNKEIYKLVYVDDKPQVQNSINNTKIINFFKEDKAENFITKEYFYEIAKIKSPEDLLGLNKSFYIDSGSTISSYKLSPNKFNINELDGNFIAMINFLNDMKTRVAANEGISQDNVLFVPVQVLRKNQGPINKNAQDKNSRHYYAKAVDIMIYLKLIDSTTNKKRIVQIPPEIIAIYAEKSKGLLQETLGHGIFLTEDKFYNHIEFLNGAGISTEERIYTGGVTDIEKKIDSQTTTSKIDLIRDIISSNINYKIPGLGILYPALQRLISQ